MQTLTVPHGSMVKRYTGHCPLLKFRYGKCYGENTRHILKEIRSKGLFNKPLKYRPGDNYEINNMPRRSGPMRDVYDGTRHRQPAYMTGYTGYVPGMNFTYGKSYGRAADDCMADFSANQRELQRKTDFNRSFVRSRSAPKMETVHSRDEIRRDLNRFIEINKYKGGKIMSKSEREWGTHALIKIIVKEFPPIAGYTGHIPRIKGSEASLSQRYHCAAKRGLELIKMERDKRKELQNANVNIKAILKDNDKKYSYWNWG
ncbi:jg4961 [Pararge aegeria aegeria]|uniref:Jg4961 protein n=1 Tax=Pararge aegeria aegeria TaxID=348720 RepID=A0A8S4SIH7_9NEOP|nr:jg4961 [Pararge aegeria aegeria]